MVKTETGAGRAVQSKRRHKGTPKSYEFAVMLIGVLLFVWEVGKFVYPHVDMKVSGWGWFWGLLIGSQMLVTKALRIPIAPGKWLDFTYVPLWVVVFTLPGPVDMLILAVFTVLIYFVFPKQFSCRQSWNNYMFHFGYQMILFYATEKSFWLVHRHVHWSVGGISLTGTIAMFASMFGLMIADTLLGSLTQKLEGQRNVFQEWFRDYWRITVVQTLLSSLSMLFAVLKSTHHPFELTVAYAFYVMEMVILFRASFRQDDYISVMRSMISLVELKDTYTKNHSQSVGHYSVILGQMLGLPSSRLQRLSIAAQLHDVGKIGIPDAVLKKEGPLSDDEFDLMKKHAGFGEQVLQPLKSMEYEAYIISRHHERLDGKGYPAQVTEKDIPLESRIISIADAYHAMISNRPYRKGLGVEEACRRLMESKGTQFDPKLVDLFVLYAQNPGKHIYRFRPFCLVH